MQRLRGVHKMGQTRYIGKRIELVTMDPFFHDISIALYRQEQNRRSVFLVHSYSGKQGTRERIDFLVATMKTLGGSNPARTACCTSPAAMHTSRR